MNSVNQKCCKNRAKVSAFIEQLCGIYQSESVRLSPPRNWPQFSADMGQIWHAASLLPKFPRMVMGVELYLQLVN